MHEYRQWLGWREKQTNDDTRIIWMVYMKNISFLQLVLIIKDVKVTHVT